MAKNGGAVRELIARVLYQTDNTSYNKVNRSIETLKKNLEKIPTAFSSSMDTALHKVRASVDKTSRSIQNLKRQIDIVNGVKSGGQGNKGGSGHSGGNLNGGALKLGNISTNSMRVQAGNVFLRGKIADKNSGGSGGHNDNGGNGGNNGDASKGSKWADRGAAVQDKGFQAVGIGSSMLAGVYFPIKEAMKFESAMADVKKVVDFDTPEQFAEMNKQILEMSTRVPMTKEQIASIVAAGGQSGIARKDLLKFTEDAAKMGIAFDISAEKAGEVMAKWRSGFRLSQKEVVELADKVNYLSNNSTAKAADITEVITRMGGTAETRGLKDQGSLAAMSAIALNTNAPEVVATGIKKLLGQLSGGTSLSKPTKLAIADLGFNHIELAKNMQTDAEGTIVKVLSAIKGRDESERSGIIAEIFGEEGVDVISELIKQLPELQKTMTSVSESNRSGKKGWGGSMQGEYEARISTSENAVQLAQNTLAVAETEIGTAMLPMLKELALALVPVIKSIGDFARENPKLVSSLLAGAAAIGGLLVGLGALGILVGGIMQLAPVFGVISGAIGAIGSAISAVVSFIGAMISILGGPFVAAIAAIIAILTLVYIYWDEIKAAANTCIEWIIAKFLAFLEVARVVYQAIASFLDGILQTAISVVSSLVASFFSGIEQIKSFFSGLYDYAMNILSGIASAIGSFIGEKIAWAREALGSLGNFVASVTGSIGSSVTSAQNSYAQTNNFYNPSPSSVPTIMNANNKFFAPG